MAKILIVEDDAVLLKMYGRKFTKEGFEVAEAGDGEEGLAKLAAGPAPDVVLLDVMLPKMDGFAVLAKIKENPATKNIPVFLASNLGNAQQDKDRGLQSGAADYLVKSEHTPAEIVAKIKTAIK